MRRWSWVAVMLVAVAAATLVALPAGAQEHQVELAIEQHRFVPEEVVVPAGVKVRLVVHNRDATPEEFESYPLKREKIIPGGGKATIWIGPLEPGVYAFFGEFHEDTAKGRVVVR